ncbi:DUF4145 domain-containing protein [Paenibacillus odorifer]|uniref:DUF4145 domain-containing protein n=1 Tax=Paenibacillus odorifer TaxID=189426 RepID=A0AAD0KPS7_9BACL|nr:DUF4145 domain-containing protein [Paenibacillus odorifer]AWV35168.1 hypothetical protein CD191_22425 [Paenibacillus odorifer]
MNYINPVVKLNSFTCPYCNTLAQQIWHEATIRKHRSGDFMFEIGYSEMPTIDKIHISTCQACGEYHLWFNNSMIKPDSTGIPLPAQDMPEGIKLIYIEASEIFSKSPRASAALLRLALQHLCQHLGGDGKNINDDIGKMVKNGLDVRVQKSLDVVRITGNNAVHPGQLDIVDNSDIAARLFGLLNFIVEAMITQPKQIEAFFNELPQGAREAIEKRDA